MTCGPTRSKFQHILLSKNATMFQGHTRLLFSCCLTVPHNVPIYQSQRFNYKYRVNFDLWHATQDLFFKWFNLGKKFCKLFKGVHIHNVETLICIESLTSWLFKLYLWVYFTLKTWISCDFQAMVTVWLSVDLHGGWCIDSKTY